ncbi:MAG TPA: cellulase family glycosylhydrolase [Roseiflexaceae bacterium]|nr:cellulase family glycosylhydrolase [Roseiflexaceae bacterium]HMP38802.1 cellulase family glycosylhydrolase [Roseiflexaceae bacterium]
MRQNTYLLTARLLFILMLTGCSLLPDESGGPLAPVYADGERLRAGGRNFEVRGVNYVRATGVDPNTCWTLQFGADPRCPWDMAPIEADFDRLQQHGVNTLRVFLNFYVFGGGAPIGSGDDKGIAIEHLDALIAAANQRGMYVIPVLLIEYPQDQFAAEFYERAFELHVRPVVAHYAGKPGILAWDLFNEPDIGSPVDIRCWDWDNADFPGCFPLAVERQLFVQAVHDEVKRIDPTRLTTVGMAFAKSYFEPIESELRMADVVDFYSFHYYDNEPYHSGRYEAHWYYGQGFPGDLRRSIDELQALGLQKPVVVTEIGFPTGPDTTRSNEDLRRDLGQARDLLRNMRTSGMVIWSFQDTFDLLLGDLYTR